MSLLYKKDFTYLDSDITWSMAVTERDQKFAVWSLGNLFRHFPNSKAQVILDGGIWTETLNQFPQVEKITGRKLAGLECGGQWWARVFHNYLEYSSTKYLIKIDPDTGIHRPFSYLPDVPGPFGSIQTDEYFVSIQGGFVGFRRDVVQKIVDSKELESPDLAKYWETYAVSPQTDGVLEYCEKNQKISTDWIMGYVTSKIPISNFGFSEVKSTWKNYVQNSDLKYSITHPCKTFKL